MSFCSYKTPIQFQLYIYFSTETGLLFQSFVCFSAQLPIIEKFVLLWYRTGNLINKIIECNNKYIFNEI